MEIFISGYNTPQTYKVCLDDTISKLKDMFIEKNDFKKHLDYLYPNTTRSYYGLINLVYGGKLLDDTRTFSDYCIVSLSTIKFYLPLLNCRGNCKKSN